MEETGKEIAALVGIYLHAIFWTVFCWVFLAFLFRFPPPLSPHDLFFVFLNFVLLLAFFSLSLSLLAARYNFGIVKLARVCVCVCG